MTEKYHLYIDLSLLDAYYRTVIDMKMPNIAFFEQEDNP
jgi:hypothetical protein